MTDYYKRKKFGLCIPKGEGWSFLGHQDFAEDSWLEQEDGSILYLDGELNYHTITREDLEETLRSPDRDVTLPSSGKLSSSSSD